jgi:hypothetical protein
MFKIYRSLNKPVPELIATMKMLNMLESGNIPKMNYMELP